MDANKENMAPVAAPVVEAGHFKPQHFPSSMKGSRNARRLPLQDITQLYEHAEVSCDVSGANMGEQAAAANNNHSLQSLIIAFCSAAWDYGIDAFTFRPRHEPTGELIVLLCCAVLAAVHPSAMD